MSDKEQTSETGSAIKFNQQPDCQNSDCHEMRARLAAAAGKNPDEIEKPKSMEDCMGRSMEMLSNTFAASAKRWEMIVYPSLFAFVILAAYGFFLIYSLTSDVGKMADSMARITENMQQMSVNMDKVTQNMVLMTQTVDTQSNSMREIVLNMRGMNHAMARMNHDISMMNNNVSRPMSFMNSFMPW